MDDARIDRRGETVLITPAQNLPEPSHFQGLDRTASEQNPNRAQPADGEQKRPRRPQPNRLTRWTWQDRIAGHHGDGASLAPSLPERINTPGRFSSNSMLCANSRHGKTASAPPRKTPPISGSVIGA